MLTAEGTTPTNKITLQKSQDDGCDYTFEYRTYMFCVTGIGDPKKSRDWKVVHPVTGNTVAEFGSLATLRSDVANTCDVYLYNHRGAPWRR